MNRYLYLICIVALAVSLSSSVSAESYQVYDLSYSSGPYSYTYQAWFDINADTFSMHGTKKVAHYPYVTTTVPWVPTFNFYGTWGAFGTINNNILTPDLYATFIIDGLGAGHIEWAANTPEGYAAPLQIGKIFDGCNAVTIYSPSGYPYQATVEVDPPWDEWWPYPFSNTFYVQNVVPEPASIATVIVGLMSLPLFKRRK